MSAELFGLGLKAEMPTHVAKLVLLKLLDACEPDGRRIFPGMKSIAQVAQCSTRQAQRMMRLFTEKGLIILVDRGGRGPGDTAEYKLDVALFRRVAAEGWQAVIEGDAGETSSEADAGDEAVKKGDTMSPIAKGDTESAKGDISPAKGDTRMSPDPSIDPSVNPSVEKEGAREDQKPARQSSAELLEDLKRVHPNIAADRPTAIENAWAGLTAAERRAAHDRHGDWLAACKAAGRSKMTALSTYLREKPWTLLSAAARASTGAELWRTSGMVPAWSRLWWCLLFTMIEAERSTIGDPRTPAAAKLRRQVSLAEKSIGWKCDPARIPDFERASAAFVGVPRDGAEAAAWSAWLRSRAGVALPLPDAAHWIFVPASAPPAAGVDNLSPDDLEGLS